MLLSPIWICWSVNEIPKVLSRMSNVNCSKIIKLQLCIQKGIWSLNMKLIIIAKTLMILFFTSECSSFVKKLFWLQHPKVMVTSFESVNLLHFACLIRSLEAISFLYFRNADTLSFELLVLDNCFSMALKVFSRKIVLQQKRTIIIRQHNIHDQCFN